MIKLYADENVDRRIINGLRRRGVDVVTAQEVGMTGPIDDADHLVFATQHDRVLLTSDRDLLAVAHDWTEVGKNHAGVMYYHQRWATLGHVVREVSGIARQLDDVNDRVVFVSWDTRSAGS